MEEIIKIVRNLILLKENFSEEGENVFAYTREFHCLPFTCYVQVNEKLHLILYRAYCTFTIRGDNEPKFKEYLLKLNYQYPVGNFSYSREADEFRFKNALAFNRERPTQDAVETLIGISEFALDEQILGLIKAHNGEYDENA